MVKHPAITGQRISYELDSTGKTTTILHVTTDVDGAPGSPLETTLTDAIVEYLKEHPEITVARVNS